MALLFLLFGFTLGAQLLREVDENDTRVLPLYEGTPDQLPLYGEHK